MRHPHVPVPRPAGRGLRRRGPLAAAAGLSVLLAAGCAHAASSSAPVPASITIAAVPGVDTAPLYLAQKDGMFAAAGLSHVDIVNYSSESAELTALANGKADIAASDYGNIFYEEARNPDLRILNDGYDATAGALEVLTWPNSPITAPAALSGQSIGVPANQVLPGLADTPGHPISLYAAAADQVLSNYLGNGVESITWVPMSQQQEVTELQEHKLSAALLSEPYIYQAESQFGASVVLDACSGSTAGLPLTGYVATSSWVRDNPSASADFQAALDKAQTQAALTGQVQTVLPKLGMSTEDADLSTIGIYPTAISAINLERVVQLMSNLGMIKSGRVPAVPPMIVARRG